MASSSKNRKVSRKKKRKEESKEEVKEPRRDDPATSPDNRRQRWHQEQDSTHRTSLGIIAARSGSSASLLWLFILPTAAVMTTDVWFPDIVVGGIDVQLAVLNISGSFMDGFFTAWESGEAKPSGPVTGMFHNIADDVRAFFLSTYTSWAGMVGFAAVLAHQQASFMVGLWYMSLCVALGFWAHGVGLQLALLFASVAASTNTGVVKQSFKKDAEFLVNALLGSILAYICGTYILVITNIQSFSDAFLSEDSGTAVSSLIKMLDVDDNRNHVVTAIACSITGAFTGNLLGNLIDSCYIHPAIPRGTVFCNTLFAFLALLLPILALRESTWARSVLLQSFAGSFCGAASAFAGHSSDTRDIYRKRGGTRALDNSIANLFGSVWIFWIALQLERLLNDVDAIDVNGDGVVEFREIVAYHGYFVAGTPSYGSL